MKLPDAKGSVVTLNGVLAAIIWRKRCVKRRVSTKNASSHNMHVTNEWVCKAKRSRKTSTRRAAEVRSMSERTSMESPHAAAYNNFA